MSSKTTISQADKFYLEKGFILLEVLAAMSLIVGTWITMTQIYQGVAQRQLQLQTQKIGTRKQADAFESNEYLNSLSKGMVKHESFRVSRRTHALHDANQSIAKNDR